MRDVQIMSPLSEEERSRRAGGACPPLRERRSPVPAGRRGESFFLIRSGSVDIVIQDANGTERHLATLGPGEYFGEMSLLTGEPRSATARVMRDLVVVVITKDHFASLLETNPGAGRPISRRRWPGARRKSTPSWRGRRARRRRSLRRNTGGASADGSASSSV